MLANGHNLTKTALDEIEAGMLLRQGATVTCANEEGETPLWATRNCNTDIFLLYLSILLRRRKGRLIVSKLSWGDASSFMRLIRYG